MMDGSASAWLSGMNAGRYESLPSRMSLEIFRELKNDGLE